MPADYLPVMLSIDHPHPELEQWVAQRFEMLNGQRVHIVHKEDLPEDARAVHPEYLLAWLWDVVPKDTQRILHVDTDIVPLRPLPDIPDAPFVAASDCRGYVDRCATRYPVIATSDNFFNEGFFVARRDTQYIFEQLKAFSIYRSVPDTTSGGFLQMPINFLVQSSVDITWLPHACNTIAIDAHPDMSPGIIALHFCVLPNDTNWVIMNTLRTMLGLSKLP